MANELIRVTLEKPYASQTGILSMRYGTTDAIVPDSMNSEDYVIDMRTKQPRITPGQPIRYTLNYADEAMRAMFVERASIPLAAETDVTAALSAMLGLTPDATSEPAPPAPGGDEGGTTPPETGPAEHGASAVPPGEEQASASAPGVGASDAPSSPSGAGIDTPQDIPPPRPRPRPSDRPTPIRPSLSSPLTALPPPDHRRYPGTP